MTYDKHLQDHVHRRAAQTSAETITPIQYMKSLNWRQWVLYILLFGSFWGLLMACDGYGQTANEFLIHSLQGLALMLACGYSLCKLTKKWEREGKIKVDKPKNK